jgi:hypothetical protein
LLLLDTTFLIDAERGANRMDDLIADDDDTAIARDHGRRAVRRRQLVTGKRRAARQGFANAVAATIPIIAYDIRVAHACPASRRRSQGRPAARRAQFDHRGDGSCL